MNECVAFLFLHQFLKYTEIDKNEKLVQISISRTAFADTILCLALMSRLVQNRTNYYLRNIQFFESKLTVINDGLSHGVSPFVYFLGKAVWEYCGTALRCAQEGRRQYL